MRLIDADELLTAFPVDNEPTLTKSCVRMTIQHMPTIEPQPDVPDTNVGDTISRKAAIRWVKTECNPYGKPTLEFESGKKVIEHLEQMPSVQPEQRWIPCSEELPDEDHLTGAGVQYSDYVLMTVFNEEDDETVIDYGYLRDGEWYLVNADILIPNWWDVTAWMPLPEPYKGD